MRPLPVIAFLHSVFHFHGLGSVSLPGAQPDLVNMGCLYCPCLLGRNCRALKNAYLPNHEILQGFMSQEQYIAQQGLHCEVP